MIGYSVQTHSNTCKQGVLLRSADPARNLVKWWIVRFIWRAESLRSWSGLQAESYFAAVKLVYTIGYSASLVLLVLAVLILLLFR